MIEKNTVYQDSKDKNVAARFVYVKTAKAYADEACTVQLKASELEDLFLKGAVIVDTSVMYRPVSYKTGSVYYVTGTTTPAVATAAALAD